VNQEIKHLHTFLQKLPEVLNSSWRCAIISYHSIEDRLVKQSFQALADTWNYKLLTKKVVVPHYTEVAKNKAARSAKLRVIEKI
jgi:16S rRNA (cytosine1402-N4)-methyltransferase